MSAPAMTVNPLPAIADAIAEMCDPHQHTAKYYTWTPSRHRDWQNHTAWHPPLLEQLRQAAHTRSQSGEVKAGRHGKPGPAAPANLDALDRLQAIETQVAQWRGGLPSRGRLEDDLRSLVGLTHEQDHPQLAEDVDRWRLWCLTLAGWRTPPWRPNAPCPQCNRMPGDKAGLRVRLDRSTACCVSCGAAWGPDNVGLLAEHVRQFKGDNG